jgi:hypothetical protein
VIIEAVGHVEARLSEKVDVDSIVVSVYIVAYDYFEP